MPDMSPLNINTKSSDVDDIRRNAPLAMLFLGCDDVIGCSDTDGLYATGGGVEWFTGRSDLGVSIASFLTLSGVLTGLRGAGL